MRLMMMRHGKAEDFAQDDFHRRLTEDGISTTQLAAHALKKLGWVPDVVLSSPLLRAKETAEIMASELQVDAGLTLTEVLACGCGAADLIDLLRDSLEDEVVMVVGHEPDFSSMIGKFVGRSAAQVEVKKGSCAVIDFFGTIGAGKGVLTAHLPPKVLRTMGS